MVTRDELKEIILDHFLFMSQYTTFYRESEQKYSLIEKDLNELIDELINKAGLVLLLEKKDDVGGV